MHPAIPDNGARETLPPAANRLEPGLIALQDRRVGVRFTPHPPLPCRLSTVAGDRSWPGRVWNLSTDGVCVVFPDSRPPWTLLVLELSNASGVFSCSLLLRVVHVRTQSQGLCVLGGAFLRPLGEEELRVLLGEPGPRTANHSPTPSVLEPP